MIQFNVFIHLIFLNFLTLLIFFTTSSNFFRFQMKRNWVTVHLTWWYMKFSFLVVLDSCIIVPVPSLTLPFISYKSSVTKDSIILISDTLFRIDIKLLLYKFMIHSSAKAHTIIVWEKHNRFILKFIITNIYAFMYILYAKLF